MEEFRNIDNARRRRGRSRTQQLNTGASPVVFQLMKDYDDMDSIDSGLTLTAAVRTGRNVEQGGQNLGTVGLSDFGY